jgi:hypothetical protein
VRPPATYGDLMLRAAMGITDGVMWVQNFPLERKEFATRAIDDFRDALRALVEHTRVLLDRHRLAGIAASGAPDPRERAAVALGRLIDEAVGTVPPWLKAVARPSASPWAGAARCVRAASDLVATHADATGIPRTPDLAAVLGDPVARQAALAEVGDLAATLLSGADHLALRAIQAGVAWREVRRLVPDLGETRAYARDLAGPGSLPASKNLEDLTVAHAPIRTEEPAAEFADRMLRLRQSAWEHARSAHPSVDDLKTYATLGIAIHAHALAFHGLPPAALRTEERLPHQFASLADRGRAWQQVSRTLFTWRSAQPGDPVAAEDLNRISGLLRTFAPLTGDQPELAPGDHRNLGQALAGAAAVTADIGRWNQQTVTRMSRAHQIYVPARTLTGNQVTDDRSLTQAKLADKLGLAPTELLDAAAGLYGPTAPKKDSALLGTGGLTLRAEPLRAGAAAAAPSRDPIHRST